MKYIIEFASLEDLNLVLAAVGKLPYEQVAHIMDSVKAQGEAQLAAAQKPKEPPSGL